MRSERREKERVKRLPDHSPDIDLEDFLGIAIKPGSILVYTVNKLNTGMPQLRLGKVRAIVAGAHGPTVRVSGWSLEETDDPSDRAFVAHEKEATLRHPERCLVMSGSVQKDALWTMNYWSQTEERNV